MTEEQRNDQGAPQPPQPVDPGFQQPPVAPPTPPQPQPQPQPQQPQQPPMYAAPQPQPQAPVFYPPAPLMQLTGGMKFAWLAIGLLMGIPGLILAWLVNVDKAQQVKSDALKFAIIGFAIQVVLGFLIGLMIGGMISAAMYGMMDYGHGYYGTW
ncbi:spore coat protein SP96 [Arabiibacter massiliensis]|uniref:spore coat protein SP96 n=1 Tax=Arabiibacter massiliensis TaxID=1870985 RepID=UPI0009BC22C1|nr:spore coat protein SP96 [Arabiibacter massiliensis]